MSSKQKVEREKEKAEGLQEKRMLKGMREICNDMGDNLKEFWHSELENIKKKMQELKQEVLKSSQRIQKLQGANQITEKEIQCVKDQNEELRQSVTLLECKTMESHLRLCGIPEEDGENIYELVLDKIVHFLEEQPEDISFSFEAVYRVNSNYAKQKKLPQDKVVQMIFFK